MPGVRFGEGAGEFIRGQLDPGQESMLDEVVLMAANEGRFYPAKSKEAVAWAIKEYVRLKTEAMREDGRAIEKAAAAEVARQWSGR